MTAAPLAFIDLKAQRRRLGDRVDKAIQTVVDHGGYIMGPEVRTLEAQLAAFCGAKRAISCASGTDALLILLMAKGVGRGDAVLCPSFTFTATAEAVALTGATPVFVDVCEDDFNLNPAGLDSALAAAKAAGLTPKGVIPVDLFGQPADYAAVTAFARAEGLWVLADAAQSFGATLGDAKVGAMGDFAATSFFPAKPLGCYGDGGAIFLGDDPELAQICESVRVHGQGRDKYETVRLGITGRLDTIQAAVLIEKLAIFPDEIVARDRVAKRYNDLLRDVVAVPEVRAGKTSVWAQYTLRIAGGAAKRDAVAAALNGQGVPTAIYYPRPLHRQPPYAQCPTQAGGLPVTDRLATEVLSLPMHPYLTEADQDRVVAALRGAL